jgi:hypothetical protein
MAQGRKRRRREPAADADGEKAYSLAGSRPKKSGRGSNGIPAGSRPSGGRGSSGNGIPAGSRGGARGGGNGIPPGSRGGSRGGSGNGIRAGSRPSGGRGGSGSGIPAGSSVRSRKRRGGSGIPAGSKGAVMTLESKADTSSTLAGVDEEKGIVEAYVSVTGIEDNVGDIIEPGAYAKTLRTRTPKGVWSHRWEEPVSKTLDIKEILPGDPSLPDTLPNGDPWPAGAGALYVKTQFNLDSDIGRRAFSNVKFFSDGTGPDTAAWSIGYKTTKSTKDKTGIRRIKELELYEYSPVLHGANSHAKTLSVKSLDEAKAALEAGGYDTSELDLKGLGEAEFDGLTADEVKDLVQAGNIIDALLTEIGVKRVAPVGDPDLTVPDADARWAPDRGDADDVQVLQTLAQRLEEVVEAGDYPDLLDAADAFDAAVAAGDDPAIAATVQEFLAQLLADEADNPDPEDIDEDSEITWDDIRDVVADTFDDANRHLYGIEPDDDDEAVDEADEFDDEDDYDADPDDDGEEERPETDQADDAGSETGDGDAEAEDAGDGNYKTEFYDRGEVKSPNAAERRRAASRGEAMNDGSFPIRNRTELRKANNLRGSGNAPREAVEAHIRKRARAIGEPVPEGAGKDSDEDEKDKSKGGSKNDPGPGLGLPDLGWAGAADDVWNAIDFGDSRV